jgi:hypothetical protein
MSDMPIRAPWHLWLVGAIAVLFDAIGAFDFTMNLLQGATYMASAGMTPAQIAYYQSLPLWMMAVWGIGTLGALLASILILLRNRLAAPIFAAALVAFLLDLLYVYALSDGGTIMGPPMAVTNAVIAALLALFLLYAWAMRRRGVLR